MRTALFFNWVSGEPPTGARLVVPVAIVEQPRLAIGVLGAKAKHIVGSRRASCPDRFANGTY